ncbi:MAG TPA: hypothetical protein VK956_03495 [Verrucomicrobium sp.]|nr:hypothetical protein [Verrucomicrobium sp.]
MILDDIIAALGSILIALIEATAALAAAMANVVLALVEFVVRLFVRGFKLTRLSAKPKQESRTRPQDPLAKARLRRLVLVFGLLLAGIAAVSLLSPVISNRKLNLVAEDGHSLPFAAVIIHAGVDKLHLRTDSSGNFTCPRFGISAITVKDVRYVEKTWSKAELKAPLVVERSMLGSALDRVAGHLLKPNASK